MKAMVPLRSAYPRPAVSWVIATLLLVATNAQFAPAQELLKNFVMHEASKPTPAISFEDGQRQTRSLADFKEKVVLLNLWRLGAGPAGMKCPRSIACRRLSEVTTSRLCHCRSTVAESTRSKNSMPKSESRISQSTSTYQAKPLGNSILSESQRR